MAFRRRAKRPRVDKAHEDEQDRRIDALAALVSPEWKQYSSYDATARAPHWNGAFGGVAGPYLYEPWSTIAHGTGAFNRIGDKIHVKRWRMQCPIYWRSLYFDSINYFLIVDAYVRFDYIWYRDGDQPKPWEKSEMHYHSNAEAAESYIVGKCFQARNPVSPKHFQVVKSAILRMPENARVRQSEVGVAVSQDDGRDQEQYICLDFPFPSGWQCDYVRTASTPDENMIPGILVTCTAKYQNAVGGVSNVPAGATAGNPIVSKRMYLVDFTDS